MSPVHSHGSEGNKDGARAARLMTTLMILLSVFLWPWLLLGVYDGLAYSCNVTGSDNLYILLPLLKTSFWTSGTSHDLVH